ncbi:MAG: pilus assembly protein [Pirellulaceae bacterium]|nr:pilus assembly protein [Pirellulaceae bacterium]
MNRTHRSHPSSSCAPVRRGVAAVELAVCLPLMVIFTFTSIELCSAIYLRQSLSIAAYEGVRVACHPQGGTSDASEAAGRILTERRIHGGVVTLTPSDIDSVTKGSTIRVSVTAPAAANSLLQFGLFGSTQLTADCSMHKE